ncbi:hypothetical protein T484DRAFT_1782039, partial [Baffinella frigidus]
MASRASGGGGLLLLSSFARPARGGVVAHDPTTLSVAAQSNEQAGEEGWVEVSVGALPWGGSWERAAGTLADDAVASFSALRLLAAFDGDLIELSSSSNAGTRRVVRVSAPPPSAEAGSEAPPEVLLRFAVLSLLGGGGAILARRLGGHGADAAEVPTAESVTLSRVLRHD